MKQISGTQHIDNQIMTSLCFYQKLPELRHESFTLDCEQGEALKLYNQMCAGQSSVRKGVLLDGIYLLGGTTCHNISQMKREVIDAIEASIGCALHVSEVCSYKRTRNYSFMGWNTCA